MRHTFYSGLARISFVLAACCAAALILPLTAPGQNWEDTDQEFVQAYQRAEPYTEMPLKKLRHAVRELKGLKPDDDQSHLAAILNGVQANLQAFTKNFADCSAIESISEVRHPDDEGMRTGSNTDITRGTMASAAGASGRAKEQYRYVIALDAGDANRFTESRTASHADTETSFAKTAGFATMPLFLNASQQKLSTFHYLGTQTVDGRDSAVIAFSEHVEPAAVREHFTIGGRTIPVLLQGIVWIDPSGYQILRLRTDLLAPQAKAGLKQVSTVVSYQEVKLRNGALSLWLPREADVTLDLSGTTFENEHEYSDYQLGAGT